MAGEARELSLVIPDLFGPSAIRPMQAARQGLSLPALEVLLSRAGRDVVAGMGLEQTLFGLFKAASSPGVDLPIAAVTRQWDAQDAGDQWWLRADPVHLRADRDRLVMLGNAVLNIDDGECAQLAAELSAHFADERWRLQATNARRWYLRLDGDPRVRTEALPDVIGQDVLHHMPYGSAERHWRSMMNEAQMVLHASAVNRAREAQGQLTVNSLWLWGGGCLPQLSQGDWSQVWGNDALVQGLASLAGSPCTRVPESAGEWLEDNVTGRHLMVLDGLRERAQFGNVEGWRDYLEALDEYWLEPLFNALRQRRVAALDIIPADGTVFRVTTRHARRWWVRRRPLAQWL